VAADRDTLVTEGADMLAGGSAEMLVEGGADISMWAGEEGLGERAGTEGGRPDRVHEYAAALRASLFSSTNLALDE